VAGLAGYKALEPVSQVIEERPGDLPVEVQGGRELDKEYPEPASQDAGLREKGLEQMPSAGQAGLMGQGAG
jgi:hypothetical protein